MSNYTRMDGVASRVPSDIERKYNFGKSFAEIMGIAKDAQTHAVEAERIVKKIQEQGLEIDVVEALNVSAGTIELKSNGLVIQSKDFSLSDEKGIVTKRGIIGKWDISEDGISKATTNYFVKIASPDSDDEDVITVSKIEDGLVKSVPFCLKANGHFFASKGEFGGLSIESDCLQISNEEGKLQLFNRGVPALAVYKSNNEYGARFDSYGVTVVKAPGHDFHGGWLTLYDGITAYSLWLDHDTNTVKFETKNV